MKDLREKFVTASLYRSKENALDKCVQIANDHAKDEAIGFAEWLKENTQPLTFNWLLNTDYQKTYNLDELYEIYQQQKKKL